MREMALANGATEDQIKQATKRVDDAIEAEQGKGSERARLDSLDSKEKIRVFGSRGFGSLRRDKGLSVEDGAKPGQRSKAVYREEREVDGPGVRHSDGGDFGDVSKADGEGAGRNGGGVRVLKPIATWSPGAKVSAVLRSLWGGCCAVTGIGVRELLRTSHAKPWSECARGAERVCACSPCIWKLS